MQVEVAVLADYANMAEAGKLNVMGMFDRIWAQAFPAAHAYMVLALRLRVEYGDQGQHKMRIELRDEDGKQWGGASGELNVGAIPPGQREVMSLVLPFPGIVFPHAGEYAFTLFWDGQEKQRVPLTLAMQAAPPSPA